MVGSRVNPSGQTGFEMINKDGSSEGCIGTSCAAGGSIPDWNVPVCGNIIGMRCNFSCANGSCTVKDTLAACAGIDDAPPTSYSFITTIADFSHIIFSGITA